MDALFRALASAARREMLGRLAEADLTVGELAEPLTMTLAATSKHIKVLERVGLVRQTVAGRRHVCRLEAEPLAPASEWLRLYERFWSDRLEAMELLLQGGSGSEAADDPAEGHPVMSESAPTTEETR